MITVRLASGATIDAADRNRAPGAAEPLDVKLVVLSGNDLYHFIPDLESDDGWGIEYTRFVFDLDSIRFNERIPLDYNHADGEVIGSIDRLGAENGRLVGVGKIVPFRPDDRAAEVAYKIGLVPFGVSPTVTFDEATVTRVPKGETFVVNGRVYDGEISIIHNARILGAAVCPYPTDTGTAVAALAALNQGGIKTMSILKPNTEPTLTELEADVNTIEGEGAGNEINNPDTLRDVDRGAGTGDADPDAVPENGGQGGLGSEDADGAEGAGDEVGGGEGSDGGENAGGDPEGDVAAEPVSPEAGDEGGCGCGECEGGQGGQGGGETAELKAAIAELRNEVAALRAELDQKAGLARHGEGTEPVGFSHGGQTEMSYADAVAARLEKLRKE